MTSVVLSALLYFLLVLFVHGVGEAIVAVLDGRVVVVEFWSKFRFVTRKRAHNRTSFGLVECAKGFSFFNRVFALTALTDQWKRLSRSSFVAAAAEALLHPPLRLRLGSGFAHSLLHRGLFFGHSHCPS